MEFVDLLIKAPAIINTGILLKNYKSYIRKNSNQSKDMSDLFVGDKNNTYTKKNNTTTIDFDYSHNNM